MNQTITIKISHDFVQQIEWLIKIQYREATGYLMFETPDDREKEMYSAAIFFGEKAVILQTISLSESESALIEWPLTQSVEGILDELFNTDTDRDLYLKNEIIKNIKLNQHALLSGIALGFSSDDFMMDRKTVKLEYQFPSPK